MNHQHTRHQMPPILPALVDHLDRLYPERCASPDDSDREIWMKAGERRIVRHLRNMLEKQEREASSLTGAQRL